MRKILPVIILVITGCMDTPVPVEITTPTTKAITVLPDNDPSAFIIILDSINYSVAFRKEVKTFTDPNELSGFISSSKPFIDSTRIFVKTSLKTSNKNFGSAINALKANGFTRFALVTQPQE